MRKYYIIILLILLIILFTLIKPVKQPKLNNIIYPNDIISIYYNEEDLNNLYSYLPYKYFNINFYHNYEYLRRKYNFTHLEAINCFRYPNFFLPYVNPKHALFLDTPLVLVNKSFYLDKEFTPSNLDKIIHYKLEYTNYEILLKQEVLIYLEKMYLDAQVVGIEFVIFSGYRSYKRQEFLFYEIYNDDSISAKPGHSEHQTGYAVDLSLTDIGLTENFKYTNTYLWLDQNAHKYGFILRFPENKTQITKYSFEPWHFRYVGVDTATFIKENNLTLEEYIFSYLEI